MISNCNSVTKMRQKYVYFFVLLFPYLLNSQSIVSLQLFSNIAFSNHVVDSIWIWQINCISPQVTWIRKADVQVLTVNSYTYTTDPRFTAHSSADADEWVLKITSARLEDSGGYECQVSTETKMSTTFELEVIGRIIFMPDCRILCTQYF